MRLESRDTPLGRMLVAVEDDPEAEDHTPRSVQIAGEFGTQPAAPTQPLDVVTAAFQSAYERLVGRLRPHPDPTVETIRTEAREAMDRADAMIDQLFDEYFARIDRVATGHGGEPAIAGPVAEAVEPPDAPSLEEGADPAVPEPNAM